MVGPTGQPVRWLGITRDITARKQAADKLEKSEREIRGLLEALPVRDPYDRSCGVYHLLQRRGGGPVGPQPRARHQ